MAWRDNLDLGIAWVLTVLALMRRRLRSDLGCKRLSVSRASFEGDVRWLELGAVRFFGAGV